MSLGLAFAFISSKINSVIVLSSIMELALIMVLIMVFIRGLGMVLGIVIK